MSPGRLAVATALGIPVLLGLVSLLFRVGAIIRSSLPGRAGTEHPAGIAER
jgi:hypothetical protein